MPTPVGHALGGLAAAFIADSAVRRPQLSPALLAAAAAIAVAPDLDLLIGLAPDLHAQPRRCLRRWRHVVAGPAGPSTVSDAGRRNADGRLRLASRARLAGEGHIQSARPHDHCGRSPRRTTCPGGICSAKSRDGTGCRTNSSSGICAPSSWELRGACAVAVDRMGALEQAER